jgi:mono/diheme cytochrome c family protein
MRLPPIVFIAACALSFASVPDAGAADAERGRILYEARCGGCHGESVHAREKHQAGDFEAVRGWVRRWSANLAYAWTDDEVNDVSVYLNARYYHFRCPATVCSVTGRREDAGQAMALHGAAPGQALP